MKNYQDLETEELINKMKDTTAKDAIELIIKYSYILNYRDYKTKEIIALLLDKIKKDSNFYSIPIIYREVVLDFAILKSKTSACIVRDKIDYKLLLETLSDLSEIFTISEQIQKEVESIPKQKWYKSIIQYIIYKLFKPKFKMQLPKQDAPTFVDILMEYEMLGRIDSIKRVMDKCE